jgi:hypothetical protein
MISIQHKNLKKFAEEHVKIILHYYETYEYQAYKAIDDYNLINRWIKDVFGENESLDLFLEAKPSRLKQIINIYKSKESSLLTKGLIEEVTVKDKTIKKPSVKEVNNLIKVYENFANANDSKLRLLGEPFREGDKYSAYTFVDRLEIKVCPYCNRNYVYNIPDDHRRISQIDHFFSKDKYPFLALSFYNLVPSCGSCNHKKSNKEGGFFNPYATTFDGQSKVKFEINIKSENFMKDEDECDLNIIYKHQEIKTTFTELGLDKLYQKHKDVIQEIYLKRHIYNDEYIEGLLKDFGLFDNKEQVIALLLGNYLQPGEFNKRPLSKLTKDIAEELGLI